MPTIFFQHKSKLPTSNDFSNFNGSFPTALIRSYIMSTSQIHQSLSNSIPIYPTSSRFFQLDGSQFHAELCTTGFDIRRCDSGFRGTGENVVTSMNALLELTTPQKMAPVPILMENAHLNVMLD